MKRSVATAIALLFLLSAGTAAAAKLTKKSLAGTWNGHMEMSMNGQDVKVEVKMVFTADGKLKATAKMGSNSDTTEGDYEIRGKKLVLFAGDEREEAVVSNVKFSGKKIRGKVVPKDANLPAGASIVLSMTKK